MHANDVLESQTDVYATFLPLSCPLGSDSFPD